MLTEKEHIIIKTYQVPDKLLLYFWIFLVLMSLLSLPAAPPYVAFIAIGISAAGLLLSALKCTKVIVLDKKEKMLVVRNFMFRKCIPFSGIKEIKRIRSAVYGDWFGAVLANDPYGTPIQLSFPPKVSVHRQKHADAFARNILPQLKKMIHEA